MEGITWVTLILFACMAGCTILATPIPPSSYNWWCHSYCSGSSAAPAFTLQPGPPTQDLNGPTNTYTLFQDLQNSVNFIKQHFPENPASMTALLISTYGIPHQFDYPSGQNFQQILNTSLHYLKSFGPHIEQLIIDEEEYSSNHPGRPDVIDLKHHSLSLLCKFVSLISSTSQQNSACEDLPATSDLTDTQRLNRDRAVLNKLLTYVTRAKGKICGILSSTQSQNLGCISKR